MNATAESPQPPASSYYEMAALLERIVGPKWGETAPPLQGVDLSVVGVDGVTTTWPVAYEHVQKLRAAIFHHSHLRLITSVPYLTRETTP